jgi:malonyl-CoA O-methyltransferase
MIAMCRRKFPGQKIEFLISDAEELELNKRFDLIASNATFQWFCDLEKTIRKYASCLSQGGEIVFSTFGPRTFFELDLALKSLFKEATVTANFFASREKLQGYLKKNFRNSEVFEKVYLDESSSLKELLRKIKYSGIRGNGLGKKRIFSPRNLQRLEKIYLDRFKGIAVTYQVFYCRGIR